MLKSTQNQPEILQNQSTETDQQENFVHIDDKLPFEDYHILPAGSLWVDVPEIKTSWVHMHDNLEIGRCLKGSGIFNVHGKVLRVQAPCYMILYEGVWHSAQSNPYDKSQWNYLYLDLPYFLSRVDGAFTSIIKGLSWQNYTFPELMSAQEYPVIAMLIDQIFDESSHEYDNREEKITGLLTSLLIEHSRYMKPTDKKVADRQTINRIAPAVSYINAHYQENVSIKHLAEICFISEATLRRDFLCFAGISPMEYLQKVRIKNAAVMLTTTDKSILEIALDTGYPTVSSFNRQFKLQYKTSPRAYRKAKKIR